MPASLAILELAARGASEDGDARVGFCLRDDGRATVIVAEAHGPPELVEAASRMAVEGIRAHLERHDDLRRRLAAHPDDSLRERIREAVAEGMVMASREVWALARRRSAQVSVHVDVAVVAGTEAVLGHAGRGRAVLLHAGLAHQLTQRGFAPREGAPRVLDEAPPGHRGDDLPQPGLGEEAEPPPVETLLVQLHEGDRLVLLGASLAHAVKTAEVGRRAVGATVDQALRAVGAAARMQPGDPALAVAVQLGDAAGGRDDDRLELLRTIDLFKWCTPDELLAVVGLTEPRRYGQGELLLRQGRLNHTLFLLVAGKVGVNKDGTRIAQMGAGSVFGEMSMLDDPKASATVEALTDVEVLAIPRDAFLLALKGDASMAVKVLWSMLLRLSANLRATSKELARHKGIEDSFVDVTIEAPTVQAGHPSEEG
ncbi:MAG: cyclic nucleotide-binding domain-containing protein [Alphaproteobacteria bacterium]|nr:cyclic nucleotide-binding domain-containing protein [Alphaproteobacteria bacterium]